MHKTITGICPKTNAEKQITVEYRKIGGDGIKGNVKGGYVITKNYQCNEECNIYPCPIHEQAPKTF